MAEFARPIAPRDQRSRRSDGVQRLIKQQDAAKASMPAPKPAEEVSCWTGPFRLFDLPSELRLRIYEYILAPSGALCLSTTSQKRRAVTPIITPALLATSHQIHNEASDILFEENEITIAVNAHDTCWPTISENRLPQRVLEKLQHMCVILDCTDYFAASYADVDFGPFEGLTSLRSLRIAMVCRRDSPEQVLAGSRHIPHLRNYNVVAQLLERVPASAKLLFGTETGSQQHDVVCALKGKRAVRRVCDDEEAPAADLEAAANGVLDLVRGCKSGVAVDVFAESHAVLRLNSVGERGRVFVQV